MKVSEKGAAQAAVLEESAGGGDRVILVYAGDEAMVERHEEALADHYGVPRERVVKNPDQYWSPSPPALILTRTSFDFLNPAREVLVEKIPLDRALDDIARAKAGGDPLQAFAVAVEELERELGKKAAAEDELNRLTRERVEALDHAARTDEGSETLADLDRRMQVLARRIELVQEALDHGMKERAYASGAFAFAILRPAAESAAQTLRVAATRTVCRLLPEESVGAVEEYLAKLTDPAAVEELSHERWKAAGHLHAQALGLAKLTAPGIAAGRLLAQVAEHSVLQRGAQQTRLDQMLVSLRGIAASTDGAKEWAEKTLAQLPAVTEVGKAWG